MIRLPHLFFFGILIFHCTLSAELSKGVGSLIKEIEASCYNKTHVCPLLSSEELLISSLRDKLQNHKLDDFYLSQNYTLSMLDYSFGRPFAVYWSQRLLRDLLPLYVDQIVSLWLNLPEQSLARNLAYSYFKQKEQKKISITQLIRISYGRNGHRNRGVYISEGSEISISVLPPVELAIVLAHELTHALDPNINLSESLESKYESISKNSELLCAKSSNPEAEIFGAYWFSKLYAELFMEPLAARNTCLILLELIENKVISRLAESDAHYFAPVLKGEMSCENFTILMTRASVKNANLFWSPKKAQYYLVYKKMMEWHKKNKFEALVYELPEPIRVCP